MDEERLKAGHDWERSIEEGLEWAAADPERGRIVLLMTPYSVRRPDGYCLNEIARAVSRNLMVVPVMLVWCEPPLSICRIQWLDMQDCMPLEQGEARFKTRVEQLVQALERDDLEFEGDQARLDAILDPLPFEADIAQHLSRFTGRQWMLDQIDAWLCDQNAARVFWITGVPGAGKTALAARLCNDRPEIVAFHLCRHGHVQKSDPRRCVLSIAYQLSTQLPEYQSRLNRLELKKLIPESDARTLFDRLIVQPLSGSFPPPARFLVVLIDALDEATHAGHNELASFLATEFATTPDWLRLMITSRPDPEVNHPLQAFTPHVLHVSSRHNEDDIRAFLQSELKPYATGGEPSESTIEKILMRSEGVFLYAEWVRQEVATGRLSVAEPDRFPQGLGGVYARYVTRQFPDVAEYKNLVAPALDNIAAALEPLEVALLAKMMEWGERHQHEFLESVGSLFRVSKGRILPFHRSAIDWLTNPEKAGPYFISLEEGNQRLTQFCWQEYLQGPEKMSPYALTHLPAHLSASANWDGAKQLLTDLRFVEVKCRVGQTYSLIDDYALLLRAFSGPAQSESRMTRGTGTAGGMQGETVSLAEVWSLRDFIVANAHFLAAFPQETIPLVFNYAPLGPVVKQATAIVATSARPWFARRGSAEKRVNQGAAHATLIGHQGPVNAMTIDADGRRVLSAGSDGTLRLWNLASGRELMTIRAHQGGVLAVAMPPDGNLAISAGDDNQVRVWDLTTGQELRELSGHRGGTICVGMAATGHVAITGGRSGVVRVWDLQSHGQCALLSGHVGSVQSVAMADNGTTALSAGADGVVTLWNVQDGEVIYSVRGSLAAAAIAASSGIAVWANKEGELYVCDITARSKPRRIAENVGKPTSVSLNCDGTLAAMAYADGEVQVWDLHSPQEFWAAQCHSQTISATALSKDGKTAISADSDGMIRVWKLKEPPFSERTSRPQHSREIAHFFPNADMAVSCTKDGNFRVWRLDSGDTLCTMRGHLGPLCAVAVTPDRSMLLSGSEDYSVRLWDLDSGGELAKLSAHSNVVRTVAVTGDGKFAISGGDDGTARVWSLGSGDEVHVLHGDDGPVTAIVALQQIPIVVSASQDGSIRIWSLSSGRLVNVLGGHDGAVTALAVTEYGNMVISAGQDATLRVWDINTGQQTAILRGHTAGISSLALAPGERAVSAAGNDDALRVWDLVTGRAVVCFELHHRQVTGLVLTPDGRTVISSSEDGTVRAWNLESGEQIAVYPMSDAVCWLSPVQQTGRLVCITADGQHHHLELVNCPHFTSSFPNA